MPILAGEHRKRSQLVCCEPRHFLPRRLYPTWKHGADWGLFRDELRPSHTSSSVLEAYLHDTTCFSDRLVQLQIGIPTASSKQSTNHEKRDLVDLELESIGV